jgi:hypothetical protein
MLHHNFDPSFVVDISDEIQIKNQGIKAYASQFSLASTGSKPTPINKTGFLEFLTNRAGYLGYQIGTEYGEGFYYKGMIKIKNLMEFFT